MTAINLRHFDALGYVERSTKLGVNEDVAKLQARELEIVFDMAVANSNQRLEKELANVATKADLKDLKVILTADIKKVEVALTADIRKLELGLKDLRFELLKWVVVVGAATIVAISGIMFTLLKFMH